MQDHYRGNRGAWLRSWKITIYGHGYTPGYAKVNAATAGARALTIDWDGPADTGASDITGYDLRHKGGGDWIEVEGIATSDADDYSLTGLGVGVSYDIQVRAVNDAGPGPWSGTKTGRTTPEAPHAPSVPTLTRPRRRAANRLDRPERRRRPHHALRPAVHPQRCLRQGGRQLAGSQRRLEDGRRPP